MNILEYAMAKKLFGGSGGSGAQAYHLTSVDELPADAVDGSLAVVEGSDDILGNWKLNDVLTSVLQVIDTQEKWDDYNNNGEQTFPLVARLTGNGETGYRSVEVGCYELNGEFDGEYFEHLIFFSLYQKNYSIIADYESAEGWSAPVEQGITILEKPDAQVEQWVRENARKLSTLYSRENGEWVSKGEI